MLQKYRSYFSVQDRYPGKANRISIDDSSDRSQIKLHIEACWNIVYFKRDHQQIYILFLPSSKNQVMEIKPDLISTLWEKYGTLLGLLLIGVCCMPYTIDRSLVNWVTYFYIPLVLILISFGFVLYKDHKNFKTIKLQPSSIRNQRNGDL